MAVLDSENRSPWGCGSELMLVIKSHVAYMEHKGQRGFLCAWQL